MKKEHLLRVMQRMKSSNEISNSQKDNKRSRSLEKQEVEPAKAMFYEATFMVTNLKGLHARPCAEIARCAGRFQSQIYLYFESKCVEAKSLLGLLTLAAPYESVVGISAEGKDAEKAIAAILTLARRGFDIGH